MSDAASPRAEGVTDSERYLQRLCNRTFLSMWSYAGVFRDQGQAVPGRGDGKEVADLLVVFEDHVIIFSDKDCTFANNKPMHVAWPRWFQKAVMGGAKQVIGAERWIREYPDRLFLDRTCTRRFHVPIPDLSCATFHRVVVAHGAWEACRSFFGGSTGSLLINTFIEGDEHTSDGGKPFAIGHVSPDNGYIHVLDDSTLDIVLGTLDTVSDFVDYLSKKERFLTSDCRVTAAGEEELLAFYLTHFDSDHKHDFIVPTDLNGLGLPEGQWEDFCRSHERRRQIEANAISYAWDSMIERFSGHMRGGTLYTGSDLPITDHELVLRFLARENRTRRRMLATALVEVSHLDRGLDQPNARVFLPSNPGDPHYVFVTLAPPDDMPYDEYRAFRRELLEGYCLVAKYLTPNATDIIGLATEDRLLDRAEVSEDLVYLDPLQWNSDLEAQAKHLHEEVGLFSRRTMHRGVTYEFPVADKPARRLKGRDRNDSCPCGSGRKYKHCHGR
jgi:hypothetical protein